MIKTRIDAFKIAHGIGLKGSSYADDMRDLLSHGTPAMDSIVVKAESSVASLKIKANTGKIVHRTRQYTPKIDQRATLSDLYPVSIESLSWLSKLVGVAMVNPA